MGKAARKKKSGRKELVQQIPMRAAPNWPLLGLALVGIGLTAYLTIAAWNEQAVAGCTAGSGCDVVLNSRWSKLFGLPTAFWGFLAYSSLAAIAFIKRSDLHWKLAWAVSLLGVLYSIYLTAISFLELKAACPYCLTSLVLMATILGAVTYQRPPDLARFSWRPWLLGTVPVGLLVVLILHLHYAGVWGSTTTVEEPKMRALAEHLVKSNAKFYGAYWCPHCADQKEMFGSSASRLPYIECSPFGSGGPQASACSDMGIKSYPTWIIDGQRHVGVLTLEELARYSDFKGEMP